MVTSGFKSDVLHWSFVCRAAGYRTEKLKLAIWCGGKEQNENQMSVILRVWHSDVISAYEKYSHYVNILDLDTSFIMQI